MSILDDLAGVLPLDDEGVDEYHRTWDDLRRRITVLNERAWESRLNWPIVERWLKNFDGKSGLSVEDEQIHALYILAQFMYFGSREIRGLLRAIYIDLFFVPLVQSVRAKCAGSRDESLLRANLITAVKRTRFLGVGTPSESGVHLLYYFRQENELLKENFLDSAQILARDNTTSGFQRSLRYPDIERYIFVDDVCGSGETAVRYSKDFLEEVKSLKPDVELYYFSIFSTAEGMKKVRDDSVFGQRCAAVYELDSTYRCLSEESRYLKVVPNQIDPEKIRKLAFHYGGILAPGHAGGYEDSQMLLGFHHNTPDNTLPIIWMDGTNGSSIPWNAAFRRYPKISGVAL
ncbi:hypothetical protein [Methylorubrum sp. GM97]|uniref:phosphoribosyltransferase-like protein n=1 Tax=Methylorubrum sp. GM97 TaxID=2938232 RepID=UPI002184661A|nr:hypothetical protein [Methylorubrum sp. GM97]BDL37555.1 hypothetical protein MSPGM_01450 [Methylorubrum sp. GM97]